MNNAEYTKVLALTEEKALTIKQQVNIECEAIHNHAHCAAEAFYADLLASVPTWIQNIKCNKSVDNIFYVKRDSKAYTEEVVGKIQQKVEEATRTWAMEHLSPLVTNEITALANMVNADTKECFDQLRRLRLTLSINQRKVVDAATPSAANRIISSGASILIGDLCGAVMGGMGGWDATKKTLCCEFGSGIILGIISLFTPVGLVAIVISVIISAIIGGNWAMSSIEKNIRKTVKDETMKNLSAVEQKRQFIGMIDERIEHYLDFIRNDVDERLKLIDATTDAFKLAV